MRRIVPSSAGRGVTGPDRSGLGDVQRVPQVARRVVGRDVEQLEVHEVGLDLRALVHLEAETMEDLAQLPFDGHQGMQMAHRPRTPRSGHVHPLRAQALVKLGTAQPAEPLGHRRLERHAGRVGGRARCRALLGGKAAETAQQRRQRPGPTENREPEALHRRGIGRGGQLGLGIGADGINGGLEGRPGIRLVAHRSVAVS